MGIAVDTAVGTYAEDEETVTFPLGTAVLVDDLRACLLALALL